MAAWVQRLGDRCTTNTVTTSGGIDITPDGTQVVAAVPVTQADIWLLENFAPDLN